MLWLTPGLGPALLIHISLQVLVFQRLRRLLSPDPRSLPTHDPVRLLLSIGVCLLSTIILAPLDVIVTRLVIQRNHKPVVAELPTTSVPDAEAPAVEKADTKSAELELEADNEPLVVRYVILKISIQG